MKTPVSHRVLLGAIFFSAAVLLLSGSWYCYTSSFDTATVGLMSVNILEGERPLFFYGQPYFGALEAYLAALFLGVFGFSEFVISLSPISFTLAWVLFSYLLFTRIHNSTAGIVAAACVAFPGYYVFWYSIATYGGYSAILCIGTAILWLSLRIFQESPRRVSLSLQSICLGVLMGLGIWIHPLTFPYIAIAAAILGVFTIRERFRLDIVLWLAVSALIGLCGFFPFYFETGSFFGGVSESVQLSWSGVAGALSNLFTVNIYELIIWNFTHALESASARYLVVYGSLTLLFLASIFSLFALLTFKNNSFRKFYYLIPISFCLLFLLMYVQHHMATLKAPRYAINFWSMLLCLIWALAVSSQKKRGLRIFISLLFCLWIGYQIVGTLFFIGANSVGARQEQRIMHAVVDSAREQNLKSVVTYGDALLGYKAQKFSIFSSNKIPFSHADTERYQVNAQFSETDRDRGYLTNAKFKSSLQNTLKELDASFTITSIDEFFLFSNIQIPQQYSMQAIPSREIHAVSLNRTEGIKFPDPLTDGDQGTGLKLNDYSAPPLTFDIGKLRSLCALWMFTSQDPSLFTWKRPGQYEVHVSTDGVQYDKVYSSLPETGNGFHAGSFIYVGGPWRKIEASFAPVSARYIKIVFLDKSYPLITELFVFQTEGMLRQESSDDIKMIQEIIVSRDIDYVLADRWVSASLRKLFEGQKKSEIALPRYSTKYTNNPLRFFVRAEKGQAVVCDVAVADECEQRLTDQFGESVISRRFDLQNYSLFTLTDPGTQNVLIDRSALLWNGHVPLQTRDMALLVPWFHSLGAPVWNVDLTRTAGVYPDHWTNGEGKLSGLNYSIRHGEDKELVLYTHGWRAASDISSLQLAAIANGDVSLEFKQKNQNAYLFSLPESLTRLDSLEIHSTTFVPPGMDSRDLGIDIKRIEIQ
jgi:4-amino-4-deoxy-L-arabinose transferase-like glycosyltransferase